MTRYLCQSACLLGVLAGIAVAAPTTGPASDGQLTARQQSLLMQLADAEANIQAINKALKVTGYRVGTAYDEIDSQRKGNELMNRNGGGPVRWDRFYGKTARDYGGNNWGDAQPQQFAFIYKANNDRIARARQQIAELGRDQSALLERRRKHEADQTRLWAVLAFERIKDREIAFEPICRFKLAGGAATPHDPRPGLLGPFVLFLRSVDKAADASLKSVESDPSATFQALSSYLQAAYATLQGAYADAAGAADQRAAELKRAEELKGLCKQLADECKVVAENDVNAADRDRANEDNSKLQFRAALQESLAAFASDAAAMDNRIADVAKQWGVEVQKGVPADPIPELKTPSPQRPSETAGANPEDLFQPGRVFTGFSEGLQKKLTILERHGSTAVARFEVGPNVIRIVSGHVANGSFSWLARDVKPLKGSAGRDNTATVIGRDTLRVEYFDPRTHRIEGRYDLQLNGKPGR